MKKSAIYQTAIIALAAVVMAFALNSCADVVPSYTVINDGSISGQEWESKPVHVIDQKNVRPNIDFRIPDSLGGGVVSGGIRPVGGKEVVQIEYRGK